MISAVVPQAPLHQGSTADEHLPPGPPRFDQDGSAQSEDSQTKFAALPHFVMDNLPTSKF